MNDFRIARSKVAGARRDVLAWEVIAPLWPGASEPDEMAHVRQGTPGQQAVLALTIFAREVDNGGLYQFLWNSSGDFTPMVVEGFRRLGLADLAEILETVVARQFPAGMPSDLEERRTLLDSGGREAMKKVNDSLGDAWCGEYHLIDDLVRYIQAHPEEFFLEE